MSFTWGIDFNSNDLVLSHGKLVTVNRAEEVRQRILIALQHYWGEYFLNVQGGVPWYEMILGGKHQKTVELILRRIILTVPGVRTITSFHVVYPSTTVPRQMEINATLETIYNDTVIVSLQSPN